MIATATTFQVATTPDDGITLHGIVANIPTDPLSVFVYALLLAGLFLIVWSNRPRRPER